MASFVGKAPEFDGNTSEWDLYTECLLHFFVANGIHTAEKQRAILFSVCGNPVYKLMKSLVAPANVTSKSYTELVALVHTHYNPKLSAIVMRFKFNTCVRQSGERVAAYVARLRELAQFCDYGKTLEDMLRDHLVCGIQDKRWQRQLLAVPELKFKDAFEKVQSYEAAEANAKTLSTKKSEQLAWTPAEQSSSTKGRAPSCYRCGGRHAAQGCRFRDTIVKKGGI